MAALRRRRIGASDLEVPVVGVGCNNFGGRIDETRSSAVIAAALDAGVAFFDTADIYGAGRSEEIIGKALAGQRDKAVVATKFGGEMGAHERGGGSRRWIMEAVEASLRRLRTDHIDLYQHHFFDADTPLEETLGALDELIRSGKVRAIGCSNYDGAQIEEADALARDRGWARYVSAQNEYSLLERGEVEAKVTPACGALGLGLLPYFPLANGLLSGKYRRGAAAPPGSRLAGNAQRAGELLTDANFDIVEALEDFARERGLELIDVAIGGLAAMPEVVSVIAGATSAEQVERNARAGEWVPSDEEVIELRRLTAVDTSVWKRARSE